MKICNFNVIFNRRSIHEALCLSKEIGYDGVELWGMEPHISHEATPERIKEIRLMAEDYGLCITGISTYEGRFSTACDEECLKTVERFEKYMEILANLNAGMIRIACGGPNAFLAEHYHYEKAAYWIKKCADIAKGYGKKIIMEIHNNSLIETADSALELLDMIDRGNVGVIHDAGNMYITDTNYSHESIRKLGKKIFHVHVKGEKRISDKKLPASFENRTKHGIELFQQTLLKDSAVDYLPVFKALKEIGYDGYVSSECFADFPDTERARLDFMEIKKLLSMV